MGGLVGLFLVDGRFAFFEFGVELLFTFVYEHVFRLVQRICRAVVD